MKRRFTVHAVFLLLVINCFALSGVRSEEITLPLTEKYVFDESFSRGKTGYGHTEDCTFEKNSDVKKYPEFKSKKPAFGCLPIATEIKENEILDPFKKKQGIKFYFAFDNSSGREDKYDRLYFDLNGDLDLTNDPPIILKEKQIKREQAHYGGELLQNEVFNTMKFNLKTDTFSSELEIIPRVIVYKKKVISNFVNTKVMTGECEIEGTKISLLLHQNYLISGRYDYPYTSLDIDVKGQTSGWNLLAVHKYGSKFYQFKASPDGKTLTIYPYTGNTGELIFGKGGRDIKEVNGSGDLSGLKACVDLGSAPPSIKGNNENNRYFLPEGNYTASFISYKIDDLEVQVSDNYHSKGKPLSREGRSVVHGLEVRKDKPCIFDLSNKPEVLFASPEENKKFKPGDKVYVKAVLIDPKLDLMIRRITDYSIDKNGKNEEEISNNEKTLDPKVTILNSEGTIIASGIMPFG